VQSRANANAGAKARVRGMGIACGDGIPSLRLRLQAPGDERSSRSDRHRAMRNQWACPLCKRGLGDLLLRGPQAKATPHRPFFGSSPDWGKGCMGLMASPGAGADGLGANVPRRRPLAASSSLISPQGHPHPRCELRGGPAQDDVRVRGKPAIRCPDVAGGPLVEIKEEAFAARRMPGDIPPKARPPHRGPSGCGPACNRTICWHVSPESGRTFLQGKEQDRLAVSWHQQDAPARVSP
jgi:hypothetical protein